MTIGENLARFDGKAVKDWTIDEKNFASELVNYRIRTDWNDSNKGITWVDRGQDTYAAEISPVLERAAC